ncbi:hypothetical protein B0H14DRAFT_2755404 [Mycena olivaceomarginata]|nr:hypothetical protein B0H14DRAFT_2755404 [Mycena olivaceomarginata]
MFRRDNISQTVNNYISGGIGGPGGAGNAHGQGGGGGIGEGPALNYVFDTIENFTMNNLGLQIHNSNLYPVSGDISLMIQNSQLHDPHFSLPAPGRSLGIEAGWSEGSNHDILGVTRKVRRQGHEIGTRYTPYNKFFHPCPAITGSTEQNQSSSSHTSLSAPTLDLFSHFTSQSSHTQTSPPITLPPFCFDIPSSGPQLTHPSEYLPRIDQENLHHAPTPSSQYQHGSALLNPPPMSPVGHPHSHDSTHFTDFTTPSPWDYEYGGGRDQKHQSHHVQPLQSIHSGTFITAGNINHHHGEVGIHILSRGIALNALYNSAERFPQPRCHPETRTELIEKLYCWATDPSITRSIHWLHGPAGAGKSAVMQTLCERLQNTGQICGSFFFKRGDQTRGNAKMLFATLAYQLAICWHRLKAMVSLNVEIDPSVLGRGMDVQLHTLIVEPCKWLQNNSPPVLLIDGLDECEGHHIQQEIICLIQSAVKSHFWGVRILVASRPEAHIKETFEAEFFQGVTVSTNIQQSFEDIRTYLCHEFLRIHHKHSAMKNIPTPWPSLQTLEILVKRSSGYFVYAATVIKFVDDEYSWPSKQLDIVVQNLIPHDSEPVFATLDQLYIQILSRVKVRYHPSLCSILSVITHYPNTFTVRDLDALLGLELGTVELILRPLHSVLEIPDFRFIIRVYHASFLDFLKDETRSSSFYVGSAEHKAKLGHSILKALAYTYEDPQKNLADSSLYWCVEVHSYLNQ